MNNFFNFIYFLLDIIKSYINIDNYILNFILLKGTKL